MVAIDIIRTEKARIDFVSQPLIGFSDSAGRRQRKVECRFAFRVETTAVNRSSFAGYRLE